MVGGVVDGNLFEGRGNCGNQLEVGERTGWFEVLNIG